MSDENAIPDRGCTARLAGTRFGPVRWFDELESTNAYVLDAAEAGAPAGLVVVADVQHAGRGRFGRRWESPVGASLLASVLVRPALRREQLHLVTTAAALAAAEAIEELAGLHALVKWPNDLVLADRKVAGLLSESRGDAVVVGLGLNVVWQEFPPELAAIATALSLEGGHVPDRSDLLVHWLHRTDRWLAGLESPGGDGAVLEAVAARSATLGRRVRVELPERQFEGEAVALDDDGHLEVRKDDGHTELVTAGDVVHLRAAG